MRVFFFLTFILFSLSISAQTIEVADATFKLSKNNEQVMYYGFAAGDRIILDVNEVDNSKITSLEVTPYNSKQAIFSEISFKKIEKREIQVLRTGIYQFKFTNKSWGRRSCHLKLSRIPGNASTLNFNPTVYWRTFQDTVSVSMPERIEVRKDTSAVVVLDRTSRIVAQHSLSNEKNTLPLNFTLPKGTIAWSYFIGVGEEGQQSFKSASSKFINSVAGAASNFPGYGSMAALALYGVNFFLQPKGQDEIQFWFIGDAKNQNAFMQGKQFRSFREGKAITDAAQMKSPLNGKVFLFIRNNNRFESMQVMIKVTAVVVQSKEYGKTVRQNNYVERQEPYLKQ
ncbi:MAG: hypothetical protein Q8862_03335 [Bacteroidota bacterium]|nr:hypothetical protein [Bacteroidota bacterium]MDP4204843.1 hypothetical protein [Bacteroidota bacterium]